MTNPNLEYTIKKVFNKNSYLFSGMYDRTYVNKFVYMVRYKGSLKSEAIYFPTLKGAKSWLNKIEANYIRVKWENEFAKISRRG